MFQVRYIQERILQATYRGKQGKIMIFVIIDTAPTMLWYTDTIINRQNNADTTLFAVRLLRGNR